MRSVVFAWLPTPFIPFFLSFFCARYFRREFFSAARMWGRECAEERRAGIAERRPAAAAERRRWWRARVYRFFLYRIPWWYFSCAARAFSPAPSLFSSIACSLLLHPGGAHAAVCRLFTNRKRRAELFFSIPALSRLPPRCCHCAPCLVSSSAVRHGGVHVSLARRAVHDATPRIWDHLGSEPSC